MDCPICNAPMKREDKHLVCVWCDHTEKPKNGDARQGFRISPVWVAALIVIGLYMFRLATPIVNRVGDLSMLDADTAGYFITPQNIIRPVNAEQFWENLTATDKLILVETGPIEVSSQVLVRTLDGVYITTTYDAAANRNGFRNLNQSQWDAMRTLYEGDVQRYLDLMVKAAVRPILSQQTLDEVATTYLTNKPRVESTLARYTAHTGIEIVGVDFIMYTIEKNPDLGLVNK